MALPTTQYVVRDDRGIAYLAGTKMKVAAIVVDTVVWGFSPEEIRDNYPQLSLSQIHSALAYYYDHQEEIDAYLAEEEREVEALRAERPNPVSRDEFLRRREAARPVSSRT